MKSRLLWGFLLLTFAILPLYGRSDCESCHKHHQKYTQDYESDNSQLRQNRSGYTYVDQMHPAGYHKNIEELNRSNVEPFGPQEFEDYGDSEYEEYYNPDEDFVKGSVSTHINTLPVEYEHCSKRHLNNPYEEYARYSVSTNSRKIPTYVDYFPSLRGFPYYIGHQSGPFFGNGYGGF